MERLSEYHGWVVMVARLDWADDDWDRARLQVAEAISPFSPEDGHCIQFAEEHLNPRPTVLFSGCAHGIEAVLQLVSFIGRVFPDSYGELVVLDDADDAWSVSAARRYRLESGVCSKYESPNA